jgi:magnesium transporter
MIMDCAIYRKGVREDVDGDLSDALDAAREAGDGFMWIGLHEPTTEEFDQVAGELQLHPLAIEDAVHAHQRPKLERYDDTLFVVVKTLRYIDETSDIEVGEIMLFLGEDFVITVRHGEGSPLRTVRRRLEGDSELLRHGPGAVLYTVLDEIVDRYGAIAHEVETDIIDLERRVFAPERTTVTEDIYELKREVLEFRGAEDPLIPVLQQDLRLGGDPGRADDDHRRVRHELRPHARAPPVVGLPVGDAPHRGRLPRPVPLVPQERVAVAAPVPAGGPHQE